MLAFLLVFQEIFNGNLLPLHKGYIGVINRSQADINNRTDIKVAMKKEQNFFKEHKAYR